jgi:hypothetical protein
MRQVLELFLNANNRFLERNLSLFLDQVNERAICGALSQHLNEAIHNSDFSNYYTDTEYNRNEGKVKTIINDEYEVVSINCDLIVHSRGNIINQDNLIALEMKKSTRTDYEKEKDRKRLIALTKESYDDVWSNDGTALPEHVCGYLLGIFYEIDLTNLIIYLEFYQRGRLFESKQICLRHNNEN